MKVKELIDRLNEMDPDKEVMGYWFDWKSEVYLNLAKTKEVKELK